MYTCSSLRHSSKSCIPCLQHASHLMSFWIATDSKTNYYHVMFANACDCEQWRSEENVRERPRVTTVLNTPRLPVIYATVQSVSCKANISTKHQRFSIYYLSTLGPPVPSGKWSGNFWLVIHRIMSASGLFPMKLLLPPTGIT